MLVKGTAVLLLALSVAATDRASQEDQLFKKPEVAPAQKVFVTASAAVATPIDFAASDYSGPYDPLDPEGIVAARNRHAKIIHEKGLDTIKSYVPPGIEKMAHKEMVQLAMNEGRRFAFAHPVETAEILAIATKARDLYNRAERKVKLAERQQQQQQHFQRARH